MAAPTVVSVTPADNDSNVYRNASVVVVFSEALDPDTVHNGTLVLRDSDSNEVVESVVSLSTDGLTATLRPTTYLVNETSYTFLVIGEDVGGTTASIKSGTDDTLAVTVRTVFTVGSEIEVAALEKTEDQIEAEGDLGLPSGVVVQDDEQYLEVVSTTPENTEFGVSPDLVEIEIEFDGVINTSTINENTVSVSIEPYYPEDEFFLALPDEDGNCNFQFQEPVDENGDAYDFSDPDGTLSVSGETVTWTADGPFPRNCKVKVVLSRTIEDVDGRTLDGNRVFVFYIRMCPDLVSVDTIRDAFFPLPLTNWDDDIIGKAIYKNVMDVLPRVRWQVRTDKVYPRVREYVAYKTIDDIYRALQAENDLLAGQFKKLGDLVIRFDIKSLGVLPAGHQEAIRRYKLALQEVTARFKEIPLPFIRGYDNPEQRQFWRTRLWQADILRAFQGYSVVGGNRGNTRAHRSTKVAGYLDQWR